MKTKFLLLIFILFISCVKSSKYENKTPRIISLAPSITEMLFALDLGNQVVAVSDYCTFPPEAKKKESIGGLLNPNLEKITALKPDFLIGTESYQSFAEKLSDKNFKVVLLPEKTVQDVYVSIDSLGVLFKQEKAADSLNSCIKDSLAFYQLQDTINTPSAILVLGRSTENTRNISISGKGAFINEIWEMCGGKNAFADLGSSFAQLNREDLLHRNPDLIIEFKSNKNWTLEDEKSNRKEWQNLNIDAVKKDQIYVIGGNDFLIPGPRMYLLAKKYRQILAGYFKQSER